MCTLFWVVHNVHTVPAGNNVHTVPAGNNVHAVLGGA